MTESPTDRPERTELLSAPSADQSARQGNPEFVGAPGEIDWEHETENETLDLALRTLADAEQQTGGLTFWHP